MVHVDPLRLDAIELGRALVMSTLYGIFFVLWVVTVYVLLMKRRNRLNWPMVIVAFLMFAIVTTHWVTNNTRSFAAFIYLRDAPGGPLAYISQAVPASSLIKVMCYTLAIMLGDSLLTWRVAVVWNRWFAIPSLLFTIGHIIMSGLTFHSYLMYAKDPATTILGLSVLSYTNAAFALTLLNNVYSSGMLATKLYMVSRASGFTSGSTVRTLLHIFIESAAVYTIFTLVSTITYVSHSPIYLAITDLGTFVVGIGFCLLVVRIATAETIRRPTTHLGSTVIQCRVTQTSEQQTSHRPDGALSNQFQLTDLRKVRGW